MKKAFGMKGRDKSERIGIFNDFYPAEVKDQNGFLSLFKKAF